MFDVTQEDRERAWSIAPHRFTLDPDIKRLWMSGRYDHGSHIQAFAAHRIAAEKAATERVDAWQPIETAPRGGAPVDLWVHRPGTIPDGLRVTDAYWLAGAWREFAPWDEDFFEADDADDAEGRKWFPEIGQTIPVETSICKATHWMPLPAPPTLRANAHMPEDADHG